MTARSGRSRSSKCRSDTKSADASPLACGHRCGVRRRPVGATNRLPQHGRRDRGGRAGRGWEGNPIGRIGPDAFQVSINGQRRKVVSAQFIGQQPTPTTRPSLDRLKDAAGRSSWRLTRQLRGRHRACADRRRAEFRPAPRRSDRVGLFVYPAGTRSHRRLSARRSRSAWTAWSDRRIRSARITT